MLPEDFSVEPFKGGFMLADYSGDFGEARYCGVGLEWRLQPVCDVPFSSREEALLARDVFIESVT